MNESNNSNHSNVEIGLSCNLNCHQLLNIDAINYTFELSECPPGYGYSIEEKRCQLCEIGYFNTDTSNEQCHQCIDGLSCLGGNNIKINTYHWWQPNLTNGTFTCRNKQCCQLDDGCDLNDKINQCPSDRDYESLGCGICNENTKSAKLGTNKCGNCDNTENIGAVAVLVMYSLFLVLIFGLVVEFDANSNKSRMNNSYKTIFKFLMFQICLSLLIDFYQTLQCILLFEKLPILNSLINLNFFINIAFANIPTLNNDGFCFIKEMTILDRWQYSLVLPFIIIAESILLCVIDQCIRYLRQSHRMVCNSKNINLQYIEYIPCFKFMRFDGIRSLLFSMQFTFIPIIWNCAHLLKCVEVDFGNSDNYSVFWNAPGQECDSQIQSTYFVMLLVFTIAYFVIFIVSTQVILTKYRYYYNINTTQESKLSKSDCQHCLLMLQRLQPLILLVYPTDVTIYQTICKIIECEQYDNNTIDRFNDIMSVSASPRLSTVSANGSPATLPHTHEEPDLDTFAPTSISRTMSNHASARRHGRMKSISNASNASNRVIGGTSSKDVSINNSTNDGSNVESNIDGDNNNDNSDEVKDDIIDKDDDDDGAGIELTDLVLSKSGNVNHVRKDDVKSDHDHDTEIKPIEENIASDFLYTLAVEPDVGVEVENVDNGNDINIGDNHNGHHLNDLKFADSMQSLHLPPPTSIVAQAASVASVSPASPSHASPESSPELATQHDDNRKRNSMSSKSKTVETFHGEIVVRNSIIDDVESGETDHSRVTDINSKKKHKQKEKANKSKNMIATDMQRELQISSQSDKCRFANGCGCDIQLYIAWFIPLIAKYLCVLIHAFIHGSQLNQNISFLATMVCLMTFTLYQLFSSKFVHLMKSNMRKIYVLYSFFWLNIIQICVTQRIVAENENLYQNLAIVVNVLMWVPLIATLLLGMAIWFEKLGIKFYTRRQTQT